MEEYFKDFAKNAVKIAQKSKIQYCDARVEKVTRNSVLIENERVDNSIIREEFGIGIRILIDNAWGFASLTNPKNLQDITDTVTNAIKNAQSYSDTKKHKIKLSESASTRFKKKFPILKTPDFDQIRKIGLECDEIIRGHKDITKSEIRLGWNDTVKIFASSENIETEQTYTDTISEIVATAHQNGVTQSVNITEGGRGGMEMILQIPSVSEEIASKASQLVHAKPAKDKKTQIVMNPDFVALLTHEILGHPSEADRVLGKEMAWAGGAWWAGKIGEKIGSEQLNVIDDPTIQNSLGNYEYDDEGTKSSRTQLIKDGTLSRHFQNKETAEIFDDVPTANMRATSYKFMPLLRMACTCIAPGKYDSEEMIKEVKDGFLVCNMKIPSIDMNRYNWSISSQYAYEIKNGEIKDLVRDVIVMGTAPEFFQSIDAVGSDFMVRPITNCGKGDPMQSMMMGNGGPSIRGIATIKGV